MCPAFNIHGAQDSIDFHSETELASACLEFQGVGRMRSSGSRQPPSAETIVSRRLQDGVTIIRPETVNASELVTMEFAYPRHNTPNHCLR